MNPRSSQYRTFAQQSRGAAASCPDDARHLLLEIADHWDALAALIQRAEALLGNCDERPPGKPN